jgi:NTE family protein
LKNYIILIYIILSVSATHYTFAQDKKPKVVLVLSGGGAKGIAHIPLLQKLDSLHIVPDLIVGNSMGSIIGGLYAMGYSGDSIEKITKKIDWDKLLSGGLSLNDVGVEEKSEYQRYLAGIGIKDGKPTSVGSILNDQNLREYLSELTYPVHNIKDFDKLSIPFRAMATDVVNGKEIILSHGSLAYAMRSSMSLPAIFKPMPYGETLLVDGGVMNNFPTDVAKQMGADIIIGSDVGGGMEPKEKLDNFATVLVQTSMFPSNIKAPENRKLCDILVDHLPNLRFSTGDFNKSNEIYKDGKIATALNLDALTTLADKLKKYTFKKPELPKIANEVILDTIIYKGISKENIPLVIARANIKTKTKYNPQELISGINRAMGTNLFSQITYNYHTYEDDKLGMTLHGHEFAKNQIFASLHYDSYRGVGLILNYTGRNILAKSSRLIVSADLAEQPKIRVDFQKNFGKKKEWWWGSEMYASFLNQEIFINGKSADNILYNAFEFNNEANRNLNSLKSYVGFGLNYLYTELKPKNDPNLNPNVLSLTNYNYENIEFKAHYSFNDMDKPFFARNGTILKANVNRSLMSDVNVNFTDPLFKDISGSTNGYTKAGLSFEKRFNNKKRITYIIGIDTHFVFQDNLNNDASFSNYGYAAKYFFGGIVPSSGSNRFTFPGLNEDELSVTQFMGMKAGVQINPIGKIYLTPHLNLASVGFKNFNDYIGDAFKPKGNWDNGIDTSFILSSGVSFSYLSLLGPIHFDTSWINNIDKVRLFFSVGFSFNPSN